MNILLAYGRKTTHASSTYIDCTDVLHFPDAVDLITRPARDTF